MRHFAILLPVWASTQAVAQPVPRPEVDAARIIAAMDVCLKAPPGRDQTFVYARSQGFQDLPADNGRNFPFPDAVPLVRNDVWLRASGPNFADKSGGSCEVLAPVAKGTAYAPIVQTLQAKLGQVGTLYVSTDKSVSEQHWKIDGRFLSASLIGGDLQIYVGMPEPTDAQVAAAKADRKKFLDDMMAEEKAQRVAAPVADFGVAAAACATALSGPVMDVAKLPGLGWSTLALGGKPDSKNFAFQLGASPVRIVLSTSISPSGQCVVDGYSASRGAFGAIAGLTKKQVGAVTGKKLKDTGSTSSPGGFSRGQGYLADDLMTMLSSENFPEAMNVRITMMRVDPAKSAAQNASAAGMAAQFLPMMLRDAKPKTP